MNKPEVTHKATHSGDLKIGNAIIPAAVLDDGTRVLWQQGFLRAIGRTGRAAASAIAEGEGLQLPVFLRAENLKPFITEDIIKASQPITYRPIVPSRGGISYGYRAELLPEVCTLFMDAWDAKVLHKNQKHIYDQCKILIRAFAAVGITALVDEATGYQEVRDRQALQAILDKFLRKEFAAWAKRFPDEFYQEMFRLRGWQWRGMKVNRPSVVGKYTNDLIYQRLAPGILDELQKLNPRDDKGQREGKHHQLLTDDIGLPALQNHLFATTSFMRASSSWDQFYRSMQRAFPKLNSNLVLNFPEPEEQS